MIFFWVVLRLVQLFFGLKKRYLLVPLPSCFYSNSGMFIIHFKSQLFKSTNFTFSLFFHLLITNRRYFYVHDFCVHNFVVANSTHTHAHEPLAVLSFYIPFFTFKREKSFEEQEWLNKKLKLFLSARRRSKRSKTTNNWPM